VEIELLLALFLANIFQMLAPISSVMELEREDAEVVG